MNEELLTQFRKEPRKEFADALHHKLSRQTITGSLYPLLSRDGRNIREATLQAEEALTDANRWPLVLPRPRSYPLQGVMVALVATVLVVIVSSILILGGTGLPIRQLPDRDADTFILYLKNIWNRGNLSALNRFVSTGVVLHDSSLEEPVAGIAALAEYVEQYRADLPDITFRIQQIVRLDDRLVIDMTANILETSVPVIASARFEDGRIAETWFDVGSLRANPDIRNAVKSVEAANVTLAGQYLAFMANRTEAIQDRQGYLAEHRTFYQPAYTYHDPLSSLTRRVSAVDDWSWDQAITGAFPDLKLTGESIVASGDRVFIHYTSTGTFQNPLTLNGMVALQPTGKAVEESGIIINRMRDGRIVEQWRYMDSPIFWAEKALMLQQGGADPLALGIFGLNQ